MISLCVLKNTHKCVGKASVRTVVSLKEVVDDLLTMCGSMQNCLNGDTVVIKGKLPREDPVSFFPQFPRLILSIPKTLKFRLLNVVLLGLLGKVE